MVNILLQNINKINPFLTIKKVRRTKKIFFIYGNIFILFLLLSNSIHAQNDSIPQVDLIDLTRKAFRIKEKKDTLKQKDTPVYFSVLPCIGYAIQNGISAVLISNTSFYLADTTDNISTVSLIAEYTEYKQTMVPINISIWTKANKWNLVGDWRFYDYNVFNYGLGGNTKISSKEPVSFNYIRVYQYALRRIAKNFLGGIGYNLDHHWNVLRTDPSANPNSDFLKYGYSKTTTSSGLSACLLYDNRKNSNTPIAHEYYANAVFRSNHTFLGSNQNWQSLMFDLRTYFNPTKKSKNVIGLWGIAWFTLAGKPPYFDLPSIGWDAYTNASRQFRQGRYIGNNLVYLESEYRFNISKNGLFGGAVFANAQSVSNWPDNKMKNIIPGIGISLRTKLNKKSNVNLITSYGIAGDGSRGFFFNLGEVF